jgi:hypothetical protein
VLSLPNKALDNVSHWLYNDFVVMMKEQIMYLCDGRKFKTLKAAVAYAEKAFVKTGVVLGIEPVVVLNKNPGYIAYLANGMKL